MGLLAILIVVLSGILGIIFLKKKVKNAEKNIWESEYKIRVMALEKYKNLFDIVELLKIYNNDILQKYLTISVLIDKNIKLEMGNERENCKQVINLLKEIVREIFLMIEASTEIQQMFDTEKFKNSMEQYDEKIKKLQHTYNKNIEYYNNFTKQSYVVWLIGEKKQYLYWENKN